MACGAKMFVIKPSGINSATLEFEQAHHVERTCGSTGYSGNMNLCDKCNGNHSFTYEYEKDNPSYEGTS